MKKMGYIKQVMLIGSGANSIETDTAFNIRGEFDIDNLYGTLNFNLPYAMPGQKAVRGAPTGVLDLTRLKKFDSVILYFKEFETYQGTVRPEQMSRVFYGFIDTIRLSKQKGDFNYEITALGSLGLGDDRNLLFQRKSGELQNLLIGTPSSDNTLNNEDIGILQLAFGEQTSDVIPSVEFIDVDANTLFVATEGGKNTKEVLSAIREKYAVVIHQRGDGTLTVFTPFFLLSARETALNVNGWDFKLNDNIFNLDYGDLTSNLNAVVYMGFPPFFGQAVDPIAVQFNAGSGNTPNQNNIVYRIFYNRELKSDEDCQKAARSKLLEIARNYSVSFQTKFNPAFGVGQPFLLTDEDRFNSQQIFFIKKYNFVIDKGDVSCTVTGWAHSLEVFPEDIVIEPTGIADVDALEIRDKLDADAGTDWNGRYS